MKHVDTKKRINDIPPPPTPPPPTPPTPLLVSLTFSTPSPLLDSPEYVNDVTYINTTNIPDYTKKLKQYYCTGALQVSMCSEVYIVWIFFVLIFVLIMAFSWHTQLCF